ncbi:MAG: hypothetical protein JXR46_10305 [Calditrichaceae bacterium]|nr:hypothetical protein [Calditrichaceae bacterium]RQV92943.1 MAG: hypothetical protein EH224_13715 [Calditrichota bacterium]
MYQSDVPPLSGRAIHFAISFSTDVQHLSARFALRHTQIDQLVYQLYGLTEEEIAIIENNVK